MKRPLRRLAALLAAALSASGAPPAAAQTELVPLGSTWRYLDTGSVPDAGWILPTFDDSGWASGPAELGYGDGDEATTVGYGGDSANKHVTTYFRHSFDAVDPSALENLLLEVLRDDGVVVYLNGTEVFRDNLPDGPVSSGTLALDAIADANEKAFLAATVDPALLQAGTNLLAAEIHQVSATSSDISFNLRLAEPTPPLLEVVPLTARWRFLDDGSDQGVSWREPGFDDGSWAEGPAELGYGDGDEATVVGYGGNSSAKHITTYFRHAFELAEPARLPALQMDVRRDDGVIVYLNGTEIFRDNLPGGSVGSGTLALGAVGDADESALLAAGVDPALLVTGTNVLAAEIHQANATSSDISFALRIAEAPPATLTRGPYLQRGSASGVTLRWRTSSPTDSLVRYGKDPQNLDQTTASPAPVTDHAVVLAGLLPDTRYYYSIGNSGGVFAGGAGCHFDTHPPTGTAAPTRIWVLGDSGTANADAAAVRDAYVTYNGGDTHADVWLMLGDNAYNDGTDAEYQAAVFDMYPATLANSVLWSTLGNHDGHTADSATQSGPYYAIHTLPAAGESGGVPSGTEAYYSFDYGDIHFICLDSYETDRSADAAMAAWLESDLSATTQEWIIVYWHHPPYSKGSHDSDTEVELVEMRENFLPILDRYGVDLMLSGHSHSYERSMLVDGHYGHSSTFAAGMAIDDGDGNPAGDGAYEKPATAGSGTVYAVAGSSGKVSTGPLDHPVMIVNLLELGSMVIDVADGRLEAVFLDDAGAARDTFTITHVEPPTEVPEAPTGLLAEPAGSSGIRLAWTDNSAIESGYLVQRSLDLSTWTTVEGALPADSTTFSDSGLTAGTTYTYRVYAMNLNGLSAASNLASATTEEEPAFLGAVASSESAGAGTVTGDYTLTHAFDGLAQSVSEIESGGKPANRHSFLSHTWRFDLPAGTGSTLQAQVWSGGSTDGDSFRFEYSTDGGSSWQPAFTVTSTDAANFETAVLAGAAGGPVLVRVVDTDRTAGARALDTVHIDELHVRTDTIPGDPPQAPTDLSAVAASASEIRLAWTDHADDELGFEIERLASGGSDWQLLANAAADAVSLADTTVAAGSTYSYRLRAFNASGASAHSNIASATTPAAPVPDTVVLQATGSKIKGLITVELGWTNAESDEIEIFRNGALLTTVPNDGTHTDHTGVKGSGSFTYRVREKGDAASASNEVTVTF